MHSTHFIYSYMASDIWKKGPQTYLELKPTATTTWATLFWLAAKIFISLSHRQDDLWEIVHWVHHEGSIRRLNTPGVDTQPQSHISILEGRMAMCVAGIRTWYFSFQPVLHDWCNKGCGIWYPACGMMHIKEPLLIGKSSPCGGSMFPLLLSEWSFTICLTLFNPK